MIWLYLSPLLLHGNNKGILLCLSLNILMVLGVVVMIPRYLHMERWHTCQTQDAVEHLLLLVVALHVLWILGIGFVICKATSHQLYKFESQV